MRMTKDVRENWETFWRPLVSSRGKISVTKLANELYDFSTLIHNASVIICYATGDQASKPLTDPETVKRLIDQHIMELIESEINDRKPRKKRRSTKVRFI